MPDGVLPALVRCPVVGVVLGDVRVDPGQGELLVTGVRDGLYYQLGVRERRLGLILDIESPLVSSMKLLQCSKIEAIERILTALDGEWSSAASGGGRWTPAPSVWAS